jgi:3-phosphoshikimate 1-carboxyvinyltransferase
MLLKYNNSNINATIQLPSSKSLSNRLLILNEVLNLNIQLKNISTAKDTQDLIAALKQIKEGKNNVIDIGHAGTDMRFLTALLSVTPGEWVLTGSDRMKERPIGELVNALKQIGAQITYIEKEGFPPLEITGKKLKGGKIEIDGSISSQFISALLLIAPALEGGLEIKINNEIVSWSYILMTLDILCTAGIKVSTVLNTIKVTPLQTPNSQLRTNSELRTKNSELTVESDWSSASYWFIIVALSKNAEVHLLGLTKHSSQGDSVLPEIYKNFGVNSEFKDGELILTKNADIINYFEYNFSDCPDIAQTVAVTCLGLNINCVLKGLSTLKHKETDRLLALKNELEKFGVEVIITDDSLKILHAEQEPRNKTQEIATYGDHRMAMSFAPLALKLSSIKIENPEVVNKSYHKFWEDLRTAGFIFS